MNKPSSKKSKPLVSVIVLNWNGFEDTVEAIDSLLKQTYPNFNIICVDNASTGHDVAALTNKYGDKIRMVGQYENIGFVRAHNHIFQMLIDEDQAEYVALLNNDAVADPNWLENLMKCAIETNSSMVSGKLIKYDSRDLLDNTGLILLQTGDIVPRGEFTNVRTYSKRSRITAASGAGCMYSIRMLRQIGLFDEFFSIGYEDSELGLRAHLHNLKVMYEPKAIAYHKGSKSVNKIRNQNYSITLHRNSFYTYFSHMPILLQIIFIPFHIMKFIGIVLFGVATLRFKSLDSYLKALGLYLHNDRKIAKKRRHELLKYTKPSLLKLMLLHKNFLPHYLRYGLFSLKNLHGIRSKLEGI